MADEQADDDKGGSVAFALDLLRVIADDAGLRPSHRMAARRHCERLKRLDCRGTGGGARDEGEIGASRSPDLRVQRSIQ